MHITNNMNIKDNEECEELLPNVSSGRDNKLTNNMNIIHISPLLLETPRGGTI